MHMVDPLNKNLMKDLYGAGAVMGKNKGLLPLYDQLMIIFRSTIAPSGVNNDNLVTPLANLLRLAKRIVEHDTPDSQYGFRVDVMDFIFNEIYEAMIKGITIPYAPFIMLLIKDTTGKEYSNHAMQQHSFKKVYQKSFVVNRSVPTSPARGSFMGDARRGRTIPPRVPSIRPQLKKLNWFQRNVLCMGNDIRRGQYDAYCERKDILKRLPRLPDEAAVSNPLSFDAWTAKEQLDRKSVV